MEKIGFFGGCFNPITNAHIGLIKEVIEKEDLSKVYFVPMGDLYEKQNLLPIDNRKEMLELAFENEEKIDLLDISNKNKKTYAIDTFKKIDKMFPDVNKFFIMGSDNYKNINKWKNSNELIHNYKYIVLDRENGISKNISSTEIRKKIKLGEDVQNLIPNQVNRYIEQKKLYK